MKNLDTKRPLKRQKSKRKEVLADTSAEKKIWHQKTMFLLFQYKTGLVSKSMKKSRLPKHFFDTNTLKSFLPVKT